jgi:hypothetical protein
MTLRLHDWSKQSRNLYVLGGGLRRIVDENLASREIRVKPQFLMFLLPRWSRVDIFEGPYSADGGWLLSAFGEYAS